VPCGNSGHAPPRCPRRQVGARKSAGAGRKADDITRPRERHGDSMNKSAQPETPHVGIFWLVQMPNSEVMLLAAGCPLDQAEPYGDCLTYGPGHYETWDHWRRDRTIDPALRAIVQTPGCLRDRHPGFRPLRAPKTACLHTCGPDWQCDHPCGFQEWRRFCPSSTRDQKSLTTCSASFELPG
jgi:hypothetical protein